MLLSCAYTVSLISPGYSNVIDELCMCAQLPLYSPGDYMPDDALFETMEVDTLGFRHGKPLVKPGTPLTTMMRRFHDWYMKTCRESGGTNTLYLRDK